MSPTAFLHIWRSLKSSTCGALPIRMCVGGGTLSGGVLRSLFGLLFNNAKHSAAEYPLSIA